MEQQETYREPTAYTWRSVDEGHEPDDDSTQRDEIHTSFPLPLKGALANSVIIFLTPTSESNISGVSWW